MLLLLGFCAKTYNTDTTLEVGSSCTYIFIEVLCERRVGVRVMRVPFFPVALLVLIAFSHGSGVRSRSKATTKRKPGGRDSAVADSARPLKGGAADANIDEVVYTVPPPPPSKKRKKKNKKNARRQQHGGTKLAAVVIAGVRSCNPSQPIIYANSTLTIIFAAQCTQHVLTIILDGGVEGFTKLVLLPCC